MDTARLISICIGQQCGEEGWGGDEGEEREVGRKWVSENESSISRRLL